MTRGQKESQQRCQARAVVGPAPVAMTKCLTRSNLWEKGMVPAYISVSVITGKPWGQEWETAGNTHLCCQEGETHAWEYSAGSFSVSQGLRPRERR